MRKVIYMDHHATTPVDPRVLRAMLPYFTKKFGNSASRTHRLGLETEKAVRNARKEVARLIHADPREIIFTSGATESNNLAIKGVAEAYKEKGRHIITVLTEHKAVLDSCKRLSMQGFQVTYLPVNREGLLDLEALEKAITDQTILISVMFANNEIGVIQPIAEIGKLARKKGVLFHCDAAQAAGKVPVDVKAMRIDLLSLSAHKMYGPKGIGALVVRKSDPQVKLVPMIDGGGHETGFRSGTLNVPGIVGFAEACRICRLQMSQEAGRIASLRDRLRDKILNKLKDASVNGSQKNRLPNNLNISFPSVETGALMAHLKNIAVSSGSACTSMSLEPSYVLKALGVPEDLRRSSIRFGLGRFNTKEEVDQVARRVVDAANSCLRHVGRGSGMPVLSRPRKI